MTSPSGRRPLGVTTTLAMLLAVLVGCGTISTTEPATMNPREVLSARPHLTETVNRYEQMRSRIKSEIDAAIGPRQWEQFEPKSDGNCGFDFPNEFDAGTVEMAIVGFRGNIPDGQWPQVREIVTRIIKMYGFVTDGQLAIDKPGRHDLNATDPHLGAQFSFGTQVGTVMTTTTGCHLLDGQK